MKRMMNDNRAVSESLGYILLFAIVLTAIAIILLVGNSIIEAEKSRDNFQNMEQNFAIIQNDMNQLALDGTPVKTTMIHMQGGTIGLDTDTARIQVSYDTTNYDHNTGQIIFSQGNNNLDNISIENGGVWKSSDDYTYMVSKPRMYITPITDTLVLNIFRLAAPSSKIANAGMGTTNIEMKYDNTTVLPPDSSTGGTVTITIDTNYPEAWKEYINSTVVNTDVTYTYVDYSNGVKVRLSPINKLIISEHWINVSLSGLYY